MKKICKNCTQEFDAKRSATQFCSQVCFGEFKTQKVECECEQCGAKVKRTKSALAKSKSGKVFCSRSCSASYNNQFKVGNKHPNYKGKVNYRKLAFDNLEHKCSHCGYNKYPEVLEVHHKDCNRDNNDLSNLRILCPTCHVETHFLTRTGKFKMVL